jgi:hypothetical protein
VGAWGAESGRGWGDGPSLAAARLVLLATLLPEVGATLAEPRGTSRFGARAKGPEDRLGSFVRGGSVLEIRPSHRVHTHAVSAIVGARKP